MRGVTWVARLGVVTFLFLVPATAHAQARVNIFAGAWSTFGGTGALDLQVTDAAQGQSAVTAVSGGSGVCPAQTTYYKGDYTVSGDSGQVAGCTDPPGKNLNAWYMTNRANSRHGTFSVTGFVNPNTFAGTYYELSDGTSGPYSGAFIGDTPNDGCCPGPPPPPPVKPPPPPNQPPTLGKVVPPANDWGQPTATTTLAAGKAAVFISPILGRAQPQATITVPSEQQTRIALIAKTGARNRGDCIFIALAKLDFVASAFWKDPPQELAAVGLTLFLHNFSYCLKIVSQLQAPRAAAAAAVLCHSGALLVDQVSRQGRRYLRATRDRKPPLLVSCTRGPNGLAMHVTTRSRHQSLRSLVGPRLLVGLYRSPKATSSANVHVTFSKR